MTSIRADGAILHRINSKYKPEHVLVFEQYHKCCLLPGKRIRQINGIKSDTRPENLEPLSKKARIASLGEWARPIPKNRRCKRCKSSKTKIERDGRHHWYRGHPNGDFAGEWLCDMCRGWDRGKEVRGIHRRVIEREPGHECCLLPNTEVYFINGDKKDIRRENLGILWKGHTVGLTTRTPKDRRCMSCGGPDFRGRWYKKAEGQYLCNRCRHSERYNELLGVKEIEYDISVLEMEQELYFDPKAVREKMAKLAKHCAVCGLTTTRRKSGRRKRGPDWYRLNPGKGPIKPGELLQCAKCYKRQSTAKLKQQLIEAAGGPEAYEEAERLRKEESLRLRRDRISRKNLYSSKYNALQNAMRGAPKELRWETYLNGPPRRCVECGSYTTKPDGRLGRPNWYKVGVVESAGGLYQCHNCYESHRRRYLSRDKRDRANARRRARTKALRELKAKANANVVRIAPLAA